MNILETVNISKSYSIGDKKSDILKDINIKIKEGEFISIIGPSGSGKSTLLHILGGLENPTTGIVKIRGKSIYDLSEIKLAEYRRRRFGFIFQQFNLIPVLNVRENIEMPLMLDRAKMDNRFITEIIEFLGLEEKENYYPNQLSGGQQQRVAIARALVSKPDIIFADEPTGNLDTKNSDEVIKLLTKSIHKYNQTVLLITHDYKIAKNTDRTIKILDGKLEL
ncbi:ABC transporter ATP-binding protein [Clostridioides difficile]|uniref:ABC transporter ATP-binding protein n=1 Tax=Clostridioides difficile TaxID=1496 RepID=UPI0009801433|nr:ABC transporter ATP-binding protein [Clostridioides difficile]MBY2229415.1 ABC transporter ATP-binding protein [Clostridioides difficile]MCI9994517.1 ABC transporter ATP-binding protein [Clostridioides difficile]MCR1465167.1 ABC transporter ATP-binding protein [Clostridioides difficile]MCV2270505.1 ABC transporter ATP-binding protein [Clostridioides difficile]MDV9711676.1 ABC transporter ATP-binding protein [Clostridioides difficile]